MARCPENVKPYDARTELTLYRDENIADWMDSVYVYLDSFEFSVSVRKRRWHPPTSTPQFGRYPRVVRLTVLWEYKSDHSFSTEI
ncbi:hypothetical protein Y710_14330 [Gordonia sp. QH-12]|nr:hypothetical protein Y710_14330 [Gordonia sp. QH-12]